MQAQLPDITAWSPWLLALALLGWRAYEAIKKGRKADATERSDEVAKAILPVTRRAEEAEKLLELTEKHRAMETADRLLLQAENERLKQKVAERDDTIDRLSSSVNSIQGRLDSVERWVEGQTRDEGRRGRKDQT